MVSSHGNSSGWILYIVIQFFFRTEMFSNKFINASINSKLKQKERPEAHVIDRADG